MFLGHFTHEEISMEICKFPREFNTEYKYNIEFNLI